MAELNIEQKKAVVQKNNAVVAAGAGSGKTFVLAQRYAHLVLERGFTVDQILTLTFTNKAASEMYQRIYKTLYQYSVEHPENKRAKEAVLNFSEARIQTLDSYCSSLIKNASRFYGISPDFTVDDEECKNKTYKLALPFLLNHRNNKVLMELIGNYNIETVAQELFVVPTNLYANIACPIDYNNLLEKQISIAKEEWNKTGENLNNIIYNLNNLLLDGSGESIKFVRDLNQIFENSATSTVPDFDEVIDFYKNSNEVAPENENLKNYLDFINKVKGVRLSKCSNETALEIKEIISELRNYVEPFVSVAIFVVNYQILKTLYPLLNEFQNLVIDAKRSSGILSFADISHLAVDLLINYPEIRNVEKDTFKAIMIDEFQDDNQLQRDMLFLLAEKPERNEKSVPSATELCPDKLFFVGDEKQSIYKFRGADVSVFRKLKSELAGSDTKNNESNSLSLITNYRSHPSLIASFNSMFGGYEFPNNKTELANPTKRNLNRSSLFVNGKQINLSGDENDIPIYEASYQWVKPNLNDKEGNPLNFDLQPRTHFAFVNEDALNNKNESEETEISKTEMEANFIAHKIKELIDSKKYKSKDCAILFRSTTKQFVYEKELRKLGIPYTSESVVGFFDESPMNNIYYLLRILVYPTDMVSYENLLYSPFVNLSQAGVNICMSDASEKNKLMEENEEAVFQNENILFTEDVEKNLSETDLRNYMDGRSKFLCLKEKAKSSSIYEIINYIWYNHGQRYETMWNETVSLYSEMYDYLFELASQIDKDGGSLSNLVDQLESLKSSGDKLSEMDIPLEKPDAVRLMTIHKSKGLEFPVVFICNCSSKGMNFTVDGLVYFDEEDGLSLNTKAPEWFPMESQNFFYTRGKEKNQLKAEAELRRVLYVAMTRAEKELYLTADLALTKKAIELLPPEGNNYLTGEDLSQEELFQCISAYCQAHIENGSSSPQLTPEHCITNNSFSGFLFYIISAWENEKIKPFTLEEIHYNEEGNVFKQRKYFSLADIIKKAIPEYSNADVLNTEEVSYPYISPSSFRDVDEEGEYIYPQPMPGSNRIYINPEIEVDKIMQSFENNEFSADKFGTIAHSFAEAAFTHVEPVFPSNLTEALSEKQKKIVFATAKEMADKFVASPLGQKTCNSPWFKNEYSFKLLVKAGSKIGEMCFPEEKIIKGQIDLVLQDDNQAGNKENSEKSYIVVDFKTDTMEDPEIHKNQLEAYRLAVSKLRKTALSNIKCYLYYLRSGHTVEIPQNQENPQN